MRKPRKDDSSGCDGKPSLQDFYSPLSGRSQPRIRWFGSPLHDTLLCFLDFEFVSPRAGTSKLRMLTLHAGATGNSAYLCGIFLIVYRICSLTSASRESVFLAALAIFQIVPESDETASFDKSVFK